MIGDFSHSGTREIATADAAREFGKELGAVLEAGDLVILDGPLGGKNHPYAGNCRGDAGQRQGNLTHLCDRP